MVAELGGPPLFFILAALIDSLLNPPLVSSKFIWATGIISKVQVFRWLDARWGGGGSILLIYCKLEDRIIVCPHHGVLCKKDEESLNHVLLLAFLFLLGKFGFSWDLLKARKTSLLTSHR